MAGELFKSMAGVDIVHVPYKESSAARTGVIGGQVEMMFDAVTTMNEQAKAGKVRALATAARRARRHAESADGVRSWRARLRRGYLAWRHGTKGTPPAV
jgi:tripartite-type tricarboxylate transporter receptor subunit TctC